MAAASSWPAAADVLESDAKIRGQIITDYVAWRQKVDAPHE